MISSVFALLVLTTSSKFSAINILTSITFGLMISLFVFIPEVIVNAIKKKRDPILTENTDFYNAQKAKHLKLIKYFASFIIVLFILAGFETNTETSSNSDDFSKSTISSSSSINEAIATITNSNSTSNYVNSASESSNSISSESAEISSVSSEKLAPSAAPTPTPTPIPTPVPTPAPPVTDNNTPQAQYVYIPKSSKKYHSNPNCSNMKNPGKITIERAQQLGYTPCKKCY